MAAKPSTFGQRLTALREKAGLSQYRLAQLSGISKQNMSQLESDKVKPGWETVQRLRVALGVTCEAFADPELEASVLTNVEPPGRPGRPTKNEPAEPVKPRSRRKK